MNFPKVSGKLLTAVKAVALSSDGTGRNNNFKVGAILFRGKKVYAAKTNCYKTHPILSRYSLWPYRHAETSCILSYGMDNCSGLDLIVARVLRKDNSLSMAKPCETCEALITEAGIRNVYYTDWNGEIQCLVFQR